MAAKDGHEVEEIIKGLLTSDERFKIGRRVLVAQLIDENYTYDQIRNFLGVGKQTVLQVQRSKSLHPKCFELINQREEKVEQTFGNKAYRMVGSPKRFQKFPEYTGFTRKDVKR